MGRSLSSQRRNGALHRWARGGFAGILPLIALILVVLIAGAALGFLTASLHTMPSLTGDIRPDASSQIYDANGKLIATIHATEHRLPVPLSKVPLNLQNAFIAAEDARFYQHIGVDPRGIMRALWANITNHGVAEGGSTITQQLAKNTLLTQEQTLKRKIQEAFLALQIERHYSKQEILEMYLNQIYFGQGAYGVQAAAQVYFGKNVEDLNLSEAAMLAGIPKSPNYYSPLNNLQAAKERQAVVLDQMVKYGYITPAQAEAARNTPLKLVHKQPRNDTFAPYFVEYVTQLLVDKYGADAVYKDGLQVYTTLDSDMQKAAEQAMTDLPVYRTDANGLKQPQGALVAINPHTGDIKAMVGGRGNDQFNRAVMAVRQPGSAFKPFVYLAALENGMTPATVIDDSPVSFGSWSPGNYDGRFHGSVTLRQALEESLNVVAVKLASQVGIDRALYFAQQMGISTLVLDGNTNDRNLAAALGGLTRGTTPLDMASAYGVIATGGVRAVPHAIVKVLDRNGRVLEQNTSQEKAVLDEKTAYILTDMMRGVIERGTGAAANIGRPAAGKTGTTSDYKDAWFVGFTPDLVAAVWMGYDNDGYLPGITGGGIPAVIWREFMVRAVQHIPARDFPRPAGVVIPAAPANNDSAVPDKNAAPNKNTDKNKKDKDTQHNGTSPPAKPGAGNKQTPPSDDADKKVPPPAAAPPPAKN